MAVNQASFRHALHMFKVFVSPEDPFDKGPFDMSHFASSHFMKSLRQKLSSNDGKDTKGFGFAVAIQVPCFQSWKPTVFGRLLYFWGRSLSSSMTGKPKPPSLVAPTRSAEHLVQGNCRKPGNPMSCWCSVGNDPGFWP